MWFNIVRIPYYACKAFKSNTFFEIVLEYPYFFEVIFNNFRNNFKKVVWYI
jgi:hypothetical protein